jgi:hypothetical protein
MANGAKGARGKAPAPKHLVLDLSTMRTIARAELPRDAAIAEAARLVARAAAVAQAVVATEAEGHSLQPGYRSRFDDAWRALSGTRGDNERRWLIRQALQVHGQGFRSDSLTGGEIEGQIRRRVPQVISWVRDDDPALAEKLAAVPSEVIENAMRAADNRGGRAKRAPVRFDDALAAVMKAVQLASASIRRPSSDIATNAARRRRPKKRT